jgi:hypothetical protein
VALTNAYCTVQQLRDQFDDGATSLPVELLERAINATSRAIEDFCGRRFWIDPSVQVLTFAPEWPDLLLLDGFEDIATTAGLVLKTDSAGDGTYATTWTIGTDFKVGPRNADKHGPAYCWTQIEAIATKAFPIASHIDSVQVTAKYGWSQVPEGVEEACILRAAQIFKRKESISGVAGFDGFGVVRISARKDPDVVDLIQGKVKMGVRAV